ncbi:MAG TPA: type 2 lantipeptide synthetase LanM, partial [Cyanobacteria bacterium UBA8803]|nr:type 2 lantipeptide synthetase LanM [Cyanobacteria bacterium UBA9273]HBL59324.1 type 2 lantipeptide synthetase LanM [Cyanobacteria bacterium UBA8803]
MNITKPDITEIVARSSFLFERLSQGTSATDADQINESQVKARLDRWCQAIAQGNWEKFQQRLAWDELDIKQVSPALGSLPIIDSQHLPDWAETLAEIVAAACSLQPLIPSPFDPANLPPWAEVLLPILTVARRKLLARLGCASLSSNSLLLELLTQDAYLTLEGSLFQKLLNLSSKTLAAEFCRFYPLGQKLLNFLGRQKPDTAHLKDPYDAFVQQLLQDGLVTFFQNYPVLARLIAVTVDFWVAATGDFLERLQLDLPDIEKMGNGEWAIGNEDKEEFTQS